MVRSRPVVLVWMLSCFLVQDVCCQSYRIPPVQFKVEPSGFSAWIPDSPNVTYVAFNGRLNERLGSGEPGEFTGEVFQPEGGKWIYRKSGIDLKFGDTIYYWVFVQKGRLGYRLDDQKYSVRGFDTANQCTNSETRVDRRQVCVGALIFTDDFEGDNLDNNKWSVDHLIPANSKNYEFVSYQNNRTILSVSGGKLTIRPIAHTEEMDIRGLLDIRQGCTGSGNECQQQHFSYQILPPVVSARIHSKVKFTYGRIELKAKLPLGDWIYPQLRLTSPTSPAEIWIAYARGNKVLRGNGGDDIGAGLLFGGLAKSAEEPKRSELLRSYRSNNGFWTDDFHNYTIHWKPDGLTLFVDGVQYGDIKSSEYQMNINFEMALTIGVGVGGINDFPDGYVSSSGVEKPWRNKEVKQVRNFFNGREQWLPTWNEAARLQIEYVKIYAL